MKLPSAPGRYDPANEAQARSQIEREDANNVKRDSLLTKLQLRDTVTGDIHTLTIANGVVTIT